MPDLLPIGLLGGTFDPIHYGHLRPALELLDALPLEHIRFLPSRQPPHRDAPQATSEQRRHMVALAIADEPRFVLDDRELQRPGPSYAVDTLRLLRQEFPRPLCLIVGADAFAQFHHWRDWRAILDLAHLIVMTRPGSSLDATALGTELGALLRERQRPSLDFSGVGGMFCQQVTALPISATAIRHHRRQGRSPRFLLPDAVLRYLLSQRLYEAPSA